MFVVLFDLKLAYKQTQLTISKMYRNQFNKSDAPLHTIDFSTLKKVNAPLSCKYEQNTLQIINQSNSALLLMGIYTLFYETVDMKDSQFSQFPFENVPRQFQQFTHEKTATEILNILKSRGKNIENLVELLNTYPVLVWILECWVRKRAINWIDTNSSLDYFGNQNELLSDLNFQIRGPLLSYVASSLRLYLKIKYELFPSAEQTVCEEQLGQISTKWEIQISFNPDNVVSGIMVEGEGELNVTNPSSKTSQHGFLRRSKMGGGGQLQTESRTSGQYKSVKKQRGGGNQCEKCGSGKRCDCNQIKRRGLGFGVTPKNNQLSSSATGIKGDPFSIGFLNQHNISKIRQTNPGQK